MKNLSISNSDRPSKLDIERGDAEPKTDWIRSVLIAVVFTFVLLVAFEMVLRASGAQPNFRDNQSRWSAIRDAAGKDTSSNAIALLGASRIRAGISLDTLRDRYPDHGVYPLGYVAHRGCAVLKDLANTTEFRGTIILSMNANWVNCQPGPNQMYSKVDSYHRDWNWAREIDARISNVVTGWFVFTDSHYSIRSLLSNTLKTGTVLPQKHYVTSRVDRQLEYDFSFLDSEKLDDIRNHDTASYLWRVDTELQLNEASWKNGLEEFSRSIETITKRGGQVVIIRMPTGGSLRRAEEEAFPRTQFWDDLAASLPADAIIHFEDEAALAAFNLPDGNHLDKRDAPEFTQKLLDLLESKGIELNRT